MIPSKRYGWPSVLRRRIPDRIEYVGKNTRTVLVVLLVLPRFVVGSPDDICSLGTLREPLLFAAGKSAWTFRFLTVFLAQRLRLRDRNGVCAFFLGCPFYWSC